MHLSQFLFTNEYVFFGGKCIAMRVDRFAVAHKNVSSGTIYYYEEDMLSAAHADVVGPDEKFQPTNPGVVYRRYTGGEQ